MKDPIFSFLVEIVGAFIVWTLKGFKGKLSDEMSGPNESNTKSWRNFTITLIFIFLIVTIIYKSDKSGDKSEPNLTRTIIVK